MYIQKGGELLTMTIYFNQHKKSFYLQGKDMTYAIKILETKLLAHAYWGKKIEKDTELNHLIKFEERPSQPYYDSKDKNFSLDMIPQEYPAYGNTDYRQPAYQVLQSNGSTITDLKYISHQIIKGKPKITLLPSSTINIDNDAKTLNITLYDNIANLEVILSYTIYKHFNVITRSAKFSNKGKEPLNLQRALSVCVDFNDNNFTFLHLSGAWGRERHINKIPLHHGSISIGSNLGGRHTYHNPFFALLRNNADEYNGEVFGFSLIYSGNFLGEIEVNQFAQTRALMGINPFDFNWLLDFNESFQTPEVVMVYSDQGINKMSQTYHKFFRKHLIRQNTKTRPILINNWEATYFDFNTEKLLNIAKIAQELGIELFVLDDGWFGNRNDANSSLGDWYVNEKKLQGGLKYLAYEINKMGMEFGLWFEPEMISPNSELFKQHPDWCIHVPDRKSSLGRNQLVLDLSRKEICYKVIEMISNILKSAPIKYVKWDMNRSLTEIGSATLPPKRQRETAHRYILGLYYIIEEITKSFPGILFESCAGGGQRFDPGMLYYMPQTWTSDNTDAVERLKIQYGTSILYPLSSMGAHVSAVPNHQIGRTTSLDMRNNVAIFGNLGYELDLTKLTCEEKNTIKRQVSEYKSIRKLMMYGDFYRLKSPFEGNETAWMVVSSGKKEAIVGYYKVLAEPNPRFYNLKLKGLDPKTKYKLNNSSIIYYGNELMYAGIHLPKLEGDFQSVVLKLESIE